MILSNSQTGPSLSAFSNAASLEVLEIHVLFNSRETILLQDCRYSIQELTHLVFKRQYFFLPGGGMFGCQNLPQKIAGFYAVWLPEVGLAAVDGLLVKLF